MGSSIFPVDEIADSFWAVPPVQATAPMPEWASYERLLEDVAPSSTAAAVISPSSASSVTEPPLFGSNPKVPVGDKQLIGRRVDDQPLMAPIVPEGHDYRAFLKSQLHRACAAVAQSRGSGSSKPGESSALPENQPQPTRSLQLESQSDGSAQGVSAAPCASDGASLGIPAAPSAQKNSGLQVKQTTSDSSGEDSDSDELEVDTGTTENQDPVEVKRVRRMQSNRESARRSRRRKQEHMNELEGQVGDLKVEHTKLLKQLTDVNQRYDVANVDNRILKADIETLRAKVKMAEETVKQVSGVNPLVLAMANIPHPSIPFMSNPMDSYTIPPMPLHPNPSHQYFNHPVPPSTMAPMNPPHPSRLDSGFHNGATNNNFLPSAVGNLQNEGEMNNVAHMSSVQNIPGADMLDWGPDHLPHPRKQL